MSRTLPTYQCVPPSNPIFVTNMRFDGFSLRLRVDTSLSFRKTFLTKAAFTTSWSISFRRCAAPLGSINHSVHIVSILMRISHISGMSVTHNLFRTQKARSYRKIIQAHGETFPGRSKSRKETDSAATCKAHSL